MAICLGGPGALFWLLVAGVFGLATKYAEGLLAIKYREVAPDGHTYGGPFSYIEKGMGKKWTWLAKLFAICGASAAILGVGTFTQVQSISNSILDFCNFKENAEWTLPLVGTISAEFGTTVIISVVLTVLVAAVLLGGIERISNVASFVVPFMAVTYIGFALFLVIYNIKAMPQAIALVVEGAFNPSAVTGGAVGSIFATIQHGISKGVFSNEAGLGSAPIAAAAAKAKEPVRQGLVTMNGAFITNIICMMTGLALVVTGAWDAGEDKGFPVTRLAFQKGIPFLNENVVSGILTMSLVFFAFTTIIGWDYYSESCIEYLSKGNLKMVRASKYVYILAVFIGPFMTTGEVWTIANIFNGVMAFPNMIAIFALSGVVAKDTKEFFKAGKHKQK
jgi:AGCS family alanine or glycine:cation symporter